MKTMRVNLVLKAEKNGELKLEKKTKGNYVSYERCTYGKKKRRKQ